MSATGTQSFAKPSKSSAIAREVCETLYTGRQIEAFSKRIEGFDNAMAYRSIAKLRAMRLKRGEKHVGRKIGFTNTNIWDEYQVFEPIWGDMFDERVRQCDDYGRSKIWLDGFAEPLIEPEIQFCVAEPLHPDMSEHEMLSNIAWVAHGCEVVQSIFPGWKFTAADTIACGGLHAALRIGAHHSSNEFDLDKLVEQLATFRVTLFCDGDEVDRGTGANVLGSPLKALKALVEMLAKDKHNPPLAPGEVVTTGVLTRAFPVKPGQTWSTKLEGIGLEGVQITFA
jgi:2-oxo-3-hexenedioate decarboxylase